MNIIFKQSKKKINISIVLSLSSILLMNTLFGLAGYCAIVENNKIKNYKVLSNESEKTIYGSVILPDSNDANIIIGKHIARTKNNFSATLISASNPSRTYEVPSTAITVRFKKIKNRTTRVLVVNLYNLVSESGKTLSPNQIPSNSYKLKISGNDLDLTTDEFNFESPTLIIGVAKTVSKS